MNHSNIKKRISAFRVPVFKIQGRPVINQDPNVVSDSNLIISVEKYLPAFVRFWAALESITGHQWKVTSYLRNSISHSLGQAIDFAPVIAPSSERFYSVYNNSDPVLYKREPLLRALQQLMPIEYSADKDFSLGVYIEPDHLHVQAIRRTVDGGIPNKLVKWGIEKPLYPDTSQRAKMPLIGTQGVPFSVIKR